MFAVTSDPGTRQALRYPVRLCVYFSALFFQYILLPAVVNGSFKSVTDSCLSVFETETETHCAKVSSALTRYVEKNFTLFVHVMQSVYMWDKHFSVPKNCT